MTQELISHKGPKPIKFSKNTPLYQIELYEWIFGDKRSRLMEIFPSDFHANIGDIRLIKILYFFLRITEISNCRFYIICPCKKIDSTDYKGHIEHIIRSNPHRDFDSRKIIFSDNMHRSFKGEFVVLLGDIDYYIIRTKNNVYGLCHHPRVRVRSNKKYRTIVIQTDG